MSNGLDPRYSPAVLLEDRPTVYETLGRALAPGLAAAIVLHESRTARCRPCLGRSCNSMSEAYSPYCARCRVTRERAELAKATAR